MYGNVGVVQLCVCVCVVIVPLVIHGMVPSVAGHGGGLADGRGQCERALSSPRRTRSAQSDS